MEPKYSMSTYATLLSLAALSTSLLGNPELSAYTSLAIALFGGGLWVSYRVRTRRYPSRRLPHRKRLDRWVAGQWAGQALVIVPTSITLAVEKWAIDPSPHQVRAFLIGAVFALAAIFASSLTDWYWVMPKVSGMAGPLPCVGVAGGRFAGVTKVWLFHRSVATVVVTAILAGVPGYLAAVAQTGGEGTAWAIFGAAASIGFNSVAGDIPTAFRAFLSPELTVGQLVQVRDDWASPDLNDALVIDVSIQGARYKTFDQVHALETPTFVEKGKLLKIDRLDEVVASNRTSGACPGPSQCSSINWYCFRNPMANVLDGANDVSPPVAWSGD